MTLNIPEKLTQLLVAQRTVTDEQSLQQVLDAVVRAGCELVDAQYGALAVFDQDGVLAQFRHRGIDEATAALLGTRPHGVGLLGAVLGEAGVVRLDDLTTDPRHGGFPAHHPVLRSFLGVPIRSGADSVELYLADPAPGRFTAADEELLRILAATAATAIDNARRYDDARRSRDWLTASGEITRALLAEADDVVLLDVVSRALDVAEAEFAALILPTDDGRLRVTVAKGVGADDFRGHVFDPTGSPMGKAIVAAESIRTHDMTLWANVDFDNLWGYGPAMIAPLVDAQGSRGAVLVMRTVGRPPFSPSEVELASMFAAQVAVALELNDRRAAAERLRGVETRHRIGRDLHDNVIQRLFAVGVGLQSVDTPDLPAEAADKLARYVADLDDTVEQIRTRVFGLQGEPDDEAEATPRWHRFPRLPAGGGTT